MRDPTRVNGFAWISVGDGIRLGYGMGFKQDYRFGGRDWLVFQTVEATLIGAGFILT